MVAAHTPQASSAPATTGVQHYDDLPDLDGTLIGKNLAEFKDNPLLMVQRAHKEAGDLVRLRMGPLRYLLVVHPEAVHHVLTKNAKNYTKGSKGYRAMKKLLGEGLLTADGDVWKTQRRIAQPGFRRSRISGYADVMVRCTEEMLDTWKDAGDDELDVSKEMMNLTLRIIGLTMMSVDLVHDAPELGEALTIALHRTDELIVSLPGADVWPTAKNRAFKDAMRVLDKAVLDAIASREAALATGDDVPNDLLTMLLEAKDPETGLGMSAAQLRDEMMTIFLAGHETTANTMSWTFHLLSQHPDIRARLEAEVDAVDESFTAAHLQDLPYTLQVLQESLRLFPPAWLMGRTLKDDDTIMGVDVPAGVHVFISPYLLGRHPDFWDAPNTFDPNRFEGDPKFDKGLYIPFIEGPRQCIGKHFAMMEAHLLLATIARKVRLEGLKDNNGNHRVVEPEPMITLRPKGGLPMTVSWR